MSRRFHSILFHRPEGSAGLRSAQPAFFTDLNLDHVAELMTAGRDQYDLKPFFYTPLRDSEAVASRHDILRDLERDAICERLDSAAQSTGRFVL